MTLLPKMLLCMECQIATAGSRLIDLSIGAHHLRCLLQIYGLATHGDSFQHFPGDDFVCLCYRFVCFVY